MDKQQITTGKDTFSISEDGDTVTLTGYALVWNELSDDRGGYRVRLLPNSARFADKTEALYHHDYKEVLASTVSEPPTLRLSSDSKGVKVEIDLDLEDTLGNDVYRRVNSRKINGMSFGMLKGGTYTVSEEVDAEGNELTVYNFSEFDADEITITVIPAFTSTSIEVKQTADVSQLSKVDDKETSETEKELLAALAKQHKYNILF